MPKRKPEFLSVDDAAAILNVSPRRVRALIKKGQLPARKFGKWSWLLLPEDVEQRKREAPQATQPWTEIVRKGRAPKFPKLRK